MGRRTRALEGGGGVELPAAVRGVVRDACGGGGGGGGGAVVREAERAAQCEYAVDDAAECLLADELRVCNERDRRARAVVAQSCAHGTGQKPSYEYVLIDTRYSILDSR